MSEKMFDILMEIRQVNKKITKEKLRLKESEHNLLNLERNLNDIKQLQFKALTVLKESELQSENTTSELQNIHKRYDELIEYTDECNINYPNKRVELKRKSIDELKERRNNLKEELTNAVVEKEELQTKINNFNLQIHIEKKKNAAMLLRLNKNLDELLLEEKELIEKLQ